MSRRSWSRSVLTGLRADEWLYANSIGARIVANETDTPGAGRKGVVQATVRAANCHGASGARKWPQSDAPAARS